MTGAGRPGLDAAAAASPNPGVSFTEEVLVPPPEPRYRATPLRAAIAALLAAPILALAFSGCLVLAYLLAGEPLASARADPEEYYFAGDVSQVPYRSVCAALLCLTFWIPFHIKGLRGPWTALVFGLGAGVFGVFSFAREVGPVGLPAQAATFILPCVLTTLVAWRIAYRRA